MTWIIYCLVFLCGIGSISSPPAPASSCQYDPGVPYKYDYQFSVLLNGDSNHTDRAADIGRHVGYKLSTEFQLTNIWQNPQNTKEQLLKIELVKPKLSVSFTMHNSDKEMPQNSKLDNLSFPPIFVHWLDGTVKRVYLLQDTESMIHIKKGLASLFQIRMTDAEVEEIDVSGRCMVIYKNNGGSIKKVKTNCQPTVNSKPKFLSSQLRSSTTTMFSETVYTLSATGIKEVYGTEDVMIQLNLWKQAALFVKSKIHMKFTGIESAQSVIKAESLDAALSIVSKEMESKIKGDTLEITPKDDFCTENCTPIQTLVREYTDYLQNENIGSMRSASAFLKLLDSFRSATKKELLTVFKDSKADTLLQLMDVLAASQTENALDVAFELIDFESNDIGVAERFLHCLAVVPHPNEMVLRKTLKLSQRKLKSPKLHATILITISSLLKNYCKEYQSKVNEKVVSTAKDIIIQGLKCKDPHCTLLQLYAIKNAAQPDFIPFLLKTAPAGGNIGRVSLEALREIGVAHFTPEVISTLHKIYNDFWPFQDLTTRVLAADLLINANPTVDMVKKLMSTLSKRDHPEVTTLVLDALINSANKNPTLRNSLVEALHNKSFGNYNNLAQNGSSSLYTKLLQDIHDANLTYGINLEMRNTGMLKRTGMDLNLNSKEEELNLLSLALSVSGFGLTDEERKAMDVPEEHSAGMELSVLGLHIRPYTFFTGTAELMGLVWSGVGSELTPAIQANLLLMDERKYVVLQNGLPLDFVLKGAISTDISGTVEVSMWNKNAHAVVKNSAALLVRGFGRVDTSFVETHVDYGLGGNTVMDMKVDLDFASSPMKMCLQIEQPAFNFRHNIRKTEAVPGTKHLIKTVRRKNVHFPAKSLALHQKNYESCRELLNPPEQKSFW